MENLPVTVLNKEIIGRLDFETLFSVASVNKELRFSVDSYVLPLLTSLRFSSLSPDGQILNDVIRRCTGLQSITLNCLRLQLQDFIFLSTSIRELNLWCCSLLSYQILPAIAHSCPHLRVLVLELVEREAPFLFRNNVAMMLNRCFYIESLSLKIRDGEVNARYFESIGFFLPRTIRTLKLQPVLENDAILLLTIRPCQEMNKRLQSLSLVLDIISDELVVTITSSLPNLVELELEDRPDKEPIENHDLTNIGLQNLASCRHLTNLSLVRSRHKYQGTFRRINDMGMLLLSEGCKGLKSIRLSGFSKVTDAGYLSLLQSCLKLEKFEVRNASYLSDLAFHDLVGASASLVEVRLLSCSLITSETVKKLASSKSLEILDLGGCRSVADSCLSSILCLLKLNSLNLTEADITDTGLSVLGQGTLPIRNLCLRGCKRVTDLGVSLLLCGGGTISQTLTALDLGYMPGITDESILTLVAAGLEIVDLCIRSCFSMTDLSMKALARKRSFQAKSKPLRRLDLFNCTCLSVDSLRWLRRSSFQGLHWLGIGHTRLASEGGTVVNEISNERPWLTICSGGCEMGCQNGWQYHK